MPTTVFSSGTIIDQGYALPAGPVGAPLLTRPVYFGGLANSGVLSKGGVSIFTPEGSSSYIVVGATAMWDVVGSQPLYLVIGSGTIPMNTATVITASAIPTGPINTPVYANLINSTAQLTVPPGNTVGYKATAGALDPVGVLELVLMRI